MQDFLNELGSSRGVRIAAVAALGLLAVFLFLISVDKLKNLGRDTTYPTKTITVQGTGEATVVPDIARITFTVQETANTVAAAQNAATTRTNDALAAMKDLGIEERDLKTLQYNVYPQYEYPTCGPNGICPPQNPTITGYQVSQSVEVKVRDTAQVGAVLEALGRLNVQNISGPEFTLDDDDAATQEARAAAIADAREKAKILAKNLGVRLGSVVSFYEDQAGYPGYDMGYGKGGVMEAASSRAAPSLPVGESQTTIRVNVTFEIN